MTRERVSTLSGEKQGATNHFEESEQKDIAQQGIYKGRWAAVVALSCLATRPFEISSP